MSEVPDGDGDGAPEAHGGAGFDEIRVAAAGVLAALRRFVEAAEQVVDDPDGVRPGHRQWSVGGRSVRGRVRRAVRSRRGGARCRPRRCERPR
ncbi:MAG: hypothetical protein R2695_15815 [Acidimicrobiales bacterium]